MCERLLTQSCLSLCSPMDCSPQAPVLMDSPGKNTAVTINLAQIHLSEHTVWISNPEQMKCNKVKNTAVTNMEEERLRKGTKWKWLSRIRLCDPWTIRSMEFPRPEYWVGSLFLLQGSSQPRDWTQVSCIAALYQLSHKGSPSVVTKEGIICGDGISDWEWRTELGRRDWTKYTFTEFFLIYYGTCWLCHACYITNNYM